MLHINYTNNVKLFIIADRYFIEILIFIFVSFVRTGEISRNRSTRVSDWISATPPRREISSLDASFGLPKGGKINLFFSYFMRGGRDWKYQLGIRFDFLVYLADETRG